MSDTKSTDTIVIDVCKDGWTGGLQLGIAKLNENGRGIGYRIAGPEYSGSQERLLRHTLDERDAEKIRDFLRAGFPDTDAAKTIECLRELTRNPKSTAQAIRDVLNAIDRLAPVVEADEKIRQQQERIAELEAELNEAARVSEALNRRLYAEQLAGSALYAAMTQPTTPEQRQAALDQFQSAAQQVTSTDKPTA
ncbi:hypothetical protein [Streptomyces malaysiensis]|uniref:hypothetical protein n=1 Tax=Streptomyces malaysiensis TaxID=92644 RepID=UPI00085305C8|nr:hypothetical protein [Streptomyces sp. SPMA113]